MSDSLEWMKSISWNKYENNYVFKKPKKTILKRTGKRECLSKSYVLHHTVERDMKQLISPNNLPDSNIFMHSICFTLIDSEMFDARVPWTVLSSWLCIK